MVCVFLGACILFSRAHQLHSNNRSSPTMKCLASIAAALITSGTLLANSPLMPVIRPTAYFVRPTANEYSGAMAGGLLVGSEFGEQKQHEVSSEWVYTWWDSDTTRPGISIASREHFMPFLLNYRFHIGHSSQSVRMYVGPSIGLTYSKIDVNARMGSLRSSMSTSDWTFTASASIGALIKIYASSSIDCGYRYLHTATGNYSLGGHSFQASSAAAHMTYAGFSFRL